MSVLDPVRERIKEIIPALPDDWADTVGSRMGIRREVVYSYAAGTRGKRKKSKVLELLRQMKTLQQEFLAEIENEL